MKTEVYRKASKEALQTFYSGDYTTATPQLRTLVADAPDKSEQGRLQLLLAASLSKSTNDEDRIASIKTYKDIVNDYSIPPVWRALALNNIALLISFRDVSFYKLYFSESPYDSYLPTSGTDFYRIQAAYQNLLKVSDETYPNSFAEYTLASEYSRDIASTNFDTNNAQNIALAKLMQKYIVEGDSRNDQALYSPNILLSAYYARAVAFGASATILKNKTLDEREAVYKKIFETADTLGQTVPNSPSAQTLLTADYFYANFLRANFPDRTADIRNLLKPYGTVQAGDPIIPTLFLNMNSAPETDFTKSRAKMLAKISPEFSAFLLRIGVK